MGGAQDLQPGATGRPRVLVVDDEPMLGELAERLLAREFEVRVATDARAALDLLLQGEGFDVVLSDVSMPEMSGMELYERAVSSRPELRSRFVFMTGGAFSAESREFLDCVSNRRVEKPFRAAALVEAVRAVAAERPT
jgi:CheY-like chemotaxis protein